LQHSIFYINRIITLPATKQAKQQEWKIILAIAQNNGFPVHIIHNLKKKLTVKKQKQKLSTTTQQAKNMGNVLISQSTTTENNQSLQTF
jgi:uncharacterized protein (UPF0335 family)